MRLINLRGLASGRAVNRLLGALARRRSHKKALLSGVERLKAREADLLGQLDEVETRFIGISNAIESTSTTSKGLVEHGEALIAMAVGRGGGQALLEKTAGEIWQGIRFVEGNNNETQELIGRLTKASTGIGAMMESEMQLNRTLGPLTYVQSMFKVESSGLPQELKTMFLALARDIEGVHHRVQNEFSERFLLIREISKKLTQSVESLGAREASARSDLAAVSSQLGASLRRMTEGFDKNKDRDSHLAHVSQSVARETGQVVISLQFHDIFLQKLHHTRTILTEVADRLGNPSMSREDEGKSLRFSEQACLIAAAHLDHIGTEFSRAGQSLLSSLDEIMRHLRDLSSDCVALRDLDEVTTGVDGAVQILLESIGEVQRLVLGTEAFARESFEAIEPVGAKTDTFTHFIRNLAFEIQIVGLNAEVQSAHTGRGTGLEILSARTSAISRETSELSAQIAAGVDSATHELSSIVSTFRQIREASLHFNSNFNLDASRATAGLHAYRDGALRVLQSIGELLPCLEERLIAARKQADIAALVSTPLKDLQIAAADLAATSRTAAEAMGAPEGTCELTDHLLAIYTMAAEGEVHRRAVRSSAREIATPHGGVADPSQPTPSPSLHDVELFADSHAAPTPFTHQSPTPAEPDLWFDPAPPADPQCSTVRIAEERTAA